MTDQCTVDDINNNMEYIKMFIKAEGIDKLIGVN